MAIAFRAIGTSVAATGATLVTTLPAGAATGDFLVIVCGSTGSAPPNVATPAGWTLLDPATLGFTGNNAGGGFPNELYVFVRVETGTPAAPTLAISGNVANNVIFAQMAAYSGTNLTLGVVGAQNGVPTAETRGLAITPGHNPCWVLFAGECSGNGTYSVSAGTMGAMNERIDAATSTGDDNAIHLYDDPWTNVDTGFAEGDNTQNFKGAGILFELYEALGAGATGNRLRRWRY